MTRAHRDTTERPRRARTAAPAGPERPGPAYELLDLQRLVGNDAVGQVLASTPVTGTAVAVQRFGENENEPGTSASGVEDVAPPALDERWTDKYWENRLRAKLEAAGEEPKAINQKIADIKVGGYWDKADAPAAGPAAGKAVKGAKKTPPPKAKSSKAGQKKAEPAANPARTADSVVKQNGPELLRDLAAAADQTGSLKVYRTMLAPDSVKVMDWKRDMKQKVEDSIEGGTTIGGLRGEFNGPKRSKREREAAGESNEDKFVIPTGNHLGDVAQARFYLRKDRANNRMLEFTLKPGAEELMFSPKYMALAASGQGAPRMLNEIGQMDGTPYEKASGGEGKLDGYIGVKPEKQGDFSLSIGSGNPTRLMFQLFIADITDVTAEQLAVIDAEDKATDEAKK